MKVIFIDSVHQSIIDEFSNAGFTCDYLPTSSPNEIIEKIHHYDGAIIRSRIEFSKEIIDKASNLKFIGRVGAGMESIDLDYAEKKGIKCYNSPEGNRDAVGEHAIGMLLMLLNKLNHANDEVKKGEWNRERNRGIEIKGKTIGIIGYGNMGSAFAKKLQGFEAKVIAYDKYKSGFGNKLVKEVSMDEIYTDSDILSLHVPLTKETNHLVNNTFIEKFHKPFYLINTARGPVVNTADLIEALKNKTISGAALDVLEYEESSFEKIDLNLNKEFQTLKSFPNLVLSPHIAGWTVESKVKLAEILAKKILHDFT